MSPVEPPAKGWSLLRRREAKAADPAAQPQDPAASAATDMAAPPAATPDAAPADTLSSAPPVSEPIQELPPVNATTRWNALASMMVERHDAAVASSGDEPFSLRGDPPPAPPAAAPEMPAVDVATPLPNPAAVASAQAAEAPKTRARRARRRERQARPKTVQPLPPLPDASTPEEVAALPRFGWIQVTKSEARAHPLFGFGGWLNAVAALLVFNIARGLAEIYDFYLATDHGGAASWMMTGLATMVTATAAAALLLLALRLRVFTAVARGYGVISIAYAALYGLVFIALTRGNVLFGAAASGMAGVLLLLYLHFSRRVNVTFLHRVRPRDPSLRQ